MTPDTFISWLLHSDWYLVGGWILVLAIAVVATFTDLTTILFRPRDSQVGNAPPEP